MAYFGAKCHLLTAARNLRTLLSPYFSTAPVNSLKNVSPVAKFLAKCLQDSRKCYTFAADKQNIINNDGTEHILLRLLLLLYRTM